MKAFGLILLFVGYGWIALDVLGFIQDQYTQSMYQGAHLPKGDTVKRDTALGAINELSLSLNSRHKMLAIPATMMFAGGLMAAFSRQRKKRDEWRRF